MRTCGCGKRGRHKPTCIESTKPKLVIEKAVTLPRSCGCGARGRHKKECSLIPEPTNITELYYDAYGKPPQVTWFRNKSRQTTIERRIKSLVRRYKAFYLTIADGDEVWYIDGGNWAHQIYDNNKYNLIGHIKNLIPFLGGKRPIAWGEWNKTPEEMQPIRRRRRK